MKELTHAEEQIMQILWKEKKAFVKDLLPHFPEPVPAYNTVSTIIRILEKKGFVSHTEFGKSHQYYPIISKEEYRSVVLSDMMKGYFNNSMKAVLSHFSKSEKMDIHEADELIKMLEELKNQNAKK